MEYRTLSAWNKKGFLVKRGEKASAFKEGQKNKRGEALFSRNQVEEKPMNNYPDRSYSRFPQRNSSSSTGNHSYYPDVDYEDSIAWDFGLTQG